MFTLLIFFFFFFQAEDGIRDGTVTGVQTCALPISSTDRWFEARMAPPAAATFSVPTTWVLASRCRPGPMMNRESWYFTRCSDRPAELAASLPGIAGTGGTAAATTPTRGSVSPVQGIGRYPQGGSGEALDPDDDVAVGRRIDRARGDDADRDLRRDRRPGDQARRQAFVVPVTGSRALPRGGLLQQELLGLALVGVEREAQASVRGGVADADHLAGLRPRRGVAFRQRVPHHAAEQEHHDTDDQPAPSLHHIQVAEASHALTLSLAPRRCHCHSRMNQIYP